MRYRSTGCKSVYLAKRCMLYRSLTVKEAQEVEAQFQKALSLVFLKGAENFGCIKHMSVVDDSETHDK